MNIEYSKKEYDEALKDFDLFNYDRLNEHYRTFRNFILSKPQKYIN
jgi:hypothetical protein